MPERDVEGEFEVTMQVGQRRPNPPDTEHNVIGGNAELPLPRDSERHCAARVNLLSQLQVPF